MCRPFLTIDQQVDLLEARLVKKQQARRWSAGLLELRWWSERESNPRHEDFQSSALPTELSDRGCLNNSLLNIPKSFAGSREKFLFLKLRLRRRSRAHGASAILMDTTVRAV